ncbi:hypothetical protein BVRB_015390 [Beta vulgaris subsp. vulgaris]|uniref:Uncharacterized protein n=1 Tax=Beta vulgaris subsp. vulgaris TaxID=3555 RepID=A0A0J8B1B3_BETVV|nr:hypothetical protein BVRB_015390 [Beta vulgaris subsp. vulgaris]
MNTRLRRERLLFDPEIERTARKTRKEFLERQREERLYLENLFKDEEEMGDERTLKELAAPKLDEEPLGIVFPTLEKPLKLNSGFLNLLPKFYGRGGEDPNRFLKEFLVVCSSMKPEGGFSGQPQRKYDPFSPTYNEGWRDHPNLRYGPRPQFAQANPRPFVHHNSQSQPSSPSLEDLVKQLTNQIGQVHTQGTQYQKKTDTHLQHLDTQIGQICTSLSNIESQLSGKLPSQTLPNPNEHAKVVTLRSGKMLDEPKVKCRVIEKETEVRPQAELGENEEKHDEKSDKEPKEKGQSTADFVVSRFKDVPPFPSRFAKAKKETLDNEILETFRKTSKTKIDVHEGNLTMEFDGELIKFNIFDAMKYPSDINNVSAIDSFDAFDWMAQDEFDKWYEKLFEIDMFDDVKADDMHDLYVATSDMIASDVMEIEEISFKKLYKQEKYVEPTT